MITPRSTKVVTVKAKEKATKATAKTNALAFVKNTGSARVLLEVPASSNILMKSASDFRSGFANPRTVGIGNQVFYGRRCEQCECE
jgi:hypothetical protein